MSDLHNRIMNLPVKCDLVNPLLKAAYANGHCDARHAAAELVLNDAMTLASSTIKVDVHMLAYYDSADVWRDVRLPHDWYNTYDDIKQAVFHYGQNDVQACGHRCSVSAGDVICLPSGKKHMVMSVGFRPLYDHEYEEYVKATRAQRMVMLLGM